MVAPRIRWSRLCCTMCPSRRVVQEWSEPLRAAIGDWVFALVQF